MRTLLIWLALLLPAIGFAQQQVINTGAAPNTGAGDPLRTAFTKDNANAAQLYGMFGTGTSLQTTGTASAADLGKVLNVSGLMLGNGLAAPTAYGGSACGANTFATSANASGVLTCTTAAQLNVIQTWTAAQTFDNLTTIATNQNSTPLLALTDSFSGSGSTGLLQISAANNSNGAGIELSGNGGVTPNKFIRANGGIFQVLNSAYGAAIFSVTDAGTASAGTINATTTLQQGGTPVQQLPTIQDTISATTYTLVATDCGRTKYLTSGSATTITVPSSTLAVGCIVVIIADGAASTITGSGLTLQLLGGTTTGNRALVNGAAVTLQFVTTTKAFAGGPGVT